MCLVWAPWFEFFTVLHVTDDECRVPRAPCPRSCVSESLLAGTGTRMKRRKCSRRPGSPTAPQRYNIQRYILHLPVRRSTDNAPAH